MQGEGLLNQNEELMIDSISRMSGGGRAEINAENDMINDNE